MSIDYVGQPGEVRYTLGVNIGFHDSSAALLRNGALVCLVEQEKISRRKYALGQRPVEAIKECLKAEGIGLDSIAAVAFGWDVMRTRLGGHRRFTPAGQRAMLFPDDPVGELPSVTWVPHHLAHAASTYYTCGADEAAIIVVDGAGESQASTIAHGHDGEIEILREWPISQSLGFFYASASKWAGLGYWGAGKLMGLSAYGRPVGEMPLRQRPDGYELTLEEVGDIAPEMGMLGFPPTYEAAVRSAFSCHYPYVDRQNEEAIAYADFAASIQQALEEAMLGLAHEARRLVDASTLVVAGGVGMNCSMIGRLLRSGLYDRIYVPPVTTDVGVSLGAALVEARRSGVFDPVLVDHAFWSTSIDADAAAQAVAAAGLVCRRVRQDELARYAAEAVAAGRIVAWARGRGEIGQRALGTRSILADPRDRRNWERLNLVKGREMWRPVAPSVLAEHIGDVMRTDVGDPGRFMLAAGEVHPSMRGTLPATTHVDGSARPQRVDRTSNPVYWELIDRFRALTGVPAVANTSFNLAGEPIVYSAADAVSTFVRAKELDLLILDQLLVTRSQDDLPGGEA